MRRLLDLLFDADSAERQRTGTFPREQLAAAALMVEAARLDGSFAPAERQRIREILQRRFALPVDLAQELLAEAEAAAEASADWHRFTREIKDALDPAGRIAVIEMLWEVAYADGELHDYEASLLRRVVGLLHVDDRESGEARRRVLARLGLAED